MRLTLKICNFYLVRHGKVQGEPALNGHTNCNVDPALQLKISEAICNQDILFDHIITSPLRRCADLAEHLQAALPTVKITINDKIQEMSFGDIDGKPFDTIKDKWPLLDSFWKDPAKNTLPEAESLTKFHHRIASAWSEITKTENKNTLIIAHGGVIRMILAEALKVDWKNPAWHSNLAITNASVTHIQISKADQNYISVKSIASTLLQ